MPARRIHRAQLTCGARCRAVASVPARLAESRQQHLASWLVLQPAPGGSQSRVAAVGGAELAEQLAEAIRSEREHASGTADLAMEPVTAGVPTPFVGH